MFYPERMELYNRIVELNYGGMMRTPADVKALAKDDAPILTSISNQWYNPVFGAQVFRQLNESATLFGVLPKFNYQRAGYRAQTTRFLNSGTGAAENASISATIKPTLAQVTVGTKEQNIAFEYSQRMKLLATRNDDMGFDLANVLESAKASYIYATDTDMNTNVTTLAANNMESIDRVCSSYSEVTNCADLHAGDADIYGLDRDAGASWADAYVSHNSGTNRPLSDSIFRDLIQGTIKAGANANTQIWYTGTDSYEQMLGYFQTQMRYAGAEYFKAKTNVNDGSTGGWNFGMEMASCYGRPVFVAPSDKVASSGSSGKLSNIYLLDIGMDPLYGEPKLGVKVLQAPITAQTTLENYPVHQKLGNKHILYSAMELECKRFGVQGKARDISAAD